MTQFIGANGAPADDEIHVKEIVGLLRRNWWVLLLFLALGVGAALYVTWRTVPVYGAVTTIRIEDESNDLPLLADLRTLSNVSQVPTEMEVVRSRTLAEDVVDSLGLQVQVVAPRGVARTEVLRSVFVERWAPSGRYVLDRQPDGSFTITEEASGQTFGPTSVAVAAALPGATFQLGEGAERHDRIVITVRSFAGAVSALQGALLVSRPNRDARIIRVNYESVDTQLVHLVPNTLASRFIARGQAIRKTEARSAVAFLEVQVDTILRQLNLAEEALTAFREGEQVVSLRAEAEAQVTSLSRLQAERNTIEAERSALQTLVTEIDREAQRVDPTAPSPYTRLISFPTLWRNAAASELLRTLNEANQQRSQLLQRRTLQDPDVENLTARIREIETQLRTSATTYLQGLTQQVGAYDRTLAQFATDLERIPAKEVQLARLERERKVFEEVLLLLQNRLQETRIIQATDDASMRVVDPAVRRAAPLRPRRLLNLMLGIALGGLLGAGAAIAREYMDDSIHTREDIQAATRGAPVLGMIPHIRNGDDGRDGATGLGGRLVAGRDPRNPVSEAYRNLRTNLTFVDPDHPPKSIVITSALPQDGKSTSAANLCITLAQQGIRTLLVDADLRRGSLHAVFGTPREPGLATVLAGRCGIGDAIRKVDLGESGTLDFLSAGSFPPNPAEILGSQRMRSLVEALEERYDLVIVDSPPLTLVTDAAVLGTKADGVVLIARAAKTEKGALTYSVEQLHNVRAKILGTVINDVDLRRDSRYGSTYGKYGYQYAYYYKDNEKQRKREAAQQNRRSPVKGV